MADKPTIKESTELLPEEGHPYLGYVVFEHLSKIIEDKEQRGLVDKWNRAAELTRNKHWKQKTGSPGLVSANLLHTHRQRTVNMLTDNNPTFNVARMGGEDDQGEFNTTVLRMSEFWWSDQEQQSVFEKSVGNGEEAGACVEKVVFNPDLEVGGEVEALNVPLFNVGILPVDCNDPRKAEGWLHYYPLDLHVAKRKWPDKADEIVGDEDVLKEIGDLRREIASAGAQKGGYSTSYSPISSTPYTFPFFFRSSVATIKKILNMAGGGSEQSDKVLIAELWVKDYTEVPEGDPVEDENGNLVQAYVPKYTGNIRCVQSCNGGKVVLSDKSNPSINPTLPPDEVSNSYLYDKFPFAIAQSITDTVDIFGMSDYEQLEQLNVEVNKTISQLTVMKDKASRCKLINPQDSGVHNDEFDNMPGIVRPNNSMVAQAIGYMKGPDIPAELISVLDIYKDVFFTVSGSFDLEQGNTGGSDVIAYKAIAALIERASTMLKGKIRNYSKLVRERGRMFVSLAQNWYTQERWITFEDGGEEQTMRVRGTDLLFPVRISVVSGSTMPRARIQEREEAISLFKLGVIDDEELLEKLDWSGRKQLLDRKKAGLLGELIEKLEAVGMPPALIEIISGIGQMDEKEFEKEVKSGDIPNMPAVLQQIVSGEQVQSPAEMQQDAEVQKVQAEIALIAEKVNTERINQAVAVAGIEFDEESVKQNWAKVVALIQDQEEKNLLGGIDTGLKIGQAATYNEKGMKSNNKGE